MTWNSDLRDELVILYQSRDSAMRVAQDVGIPAGSLPDGPTAQDRWYAILGEAEKRGLVLEIVACALKDYPDRVVLRLAAAEGETGLARREVQRLGQKLPTPLPLDRARKQRQAATRSIDFRRETLRCCGALARCRSIHARCERVSVSLLWWAADPNSPPDDLTPTQRCAVRLQLLDIQRSCLLLKPELERCLIYKGGLALARTQIQTLNEKLVSALNFTDGTQHLGAFLSRPVRAARDAIYELRRVVEQSAILLARQTEPETDTMNAASAALLWSDASKAWLLLENLSNFLHAATSSGTPDEYIWSQLRPYAVLSDDPVWLDAAAMEETVSSELDIPSVQRMAQSRQNDFMVAVFDDEHLHAARAAIGDVRDAAWKFARGWGQTVVTELEATDLSATLTG